MSDLMETHEREKAEELLKIQEYAHPIRFKPFTANDKYSQAWPFPRDRLVSSNFNLAHGCSYEDTEVKDALNSQLLSLREYVAILELAKAGYRNDNLEHIDEETRNNADIFTRNMVHFFLTTSRYGQNENEGCYGFWLSDVVLFPNTKQYDNGCYEAFWIEKPEVVKDSEGKIKYNLNKKEAIPLLISSATGYAVFDETGILNPRTGFPYSVEENSRGDDYIAVAHTTVLRFLRDVYSDNNEIQSFLDQIDPLDKGFHGVNRFIQEAIRKLRPFHTPESRDSRISDSDLGYMLDFVHPKVEFSHAGSFKSIVEGNRIAAVMIGKDYQAGNPLTIAFDYSNFPNCGILAARSSDITI